MRGVNDMKLNIIAERHEQHGDDPHSSRRDAPGGNRPRRGPAAASGACSVARRYAADAALGIRRPRLSEWLIGSRRYDVLRRPTAHSLAGWTYAGLHPEPNRVQLL